MSTVQSKGGLPQVGPHRLLRPLSAGGMGEVYLAVHDWIERRVAIKVLRKEFATDDDATARLFNEARAVNLINHPALVQISDFGQLARGGGYLVMEFLDGVTLGQRLRQHGGTLPIGEALRIGWLVASALRAAHDRQIIYRDLKPDKIMLVRNQKC